MSLAALLAVDLTTEPALRAARTLLLHAWLTTPQDLTLNRVASRVYTALDQTEPVPTAFAEPFIQRASLPIPGAVRPLGPRVLARLCNMPEHRARYMIQNRPPSTLAYANIGEACNVANALPLVFSAVQVGADASKRGYATQGGLAVTLDVAVTFEHLLFCVGDMPPARITQGMTTALRALAQLVGTPSPSTLRAYHEQYEDPAVTPEPDPQRHVEIRRRLGLHLTRTAGGRTPQHVPRVVLRRYFECLTEGMRQAEAVRRTNNEHGSEWAPYMFHNRQGQLGRAMRFSSSGELLRAARHDPDKFMAQVDRWLDTLDNRYFTLASLAAQDPEVQEGYATAAAGADLHARPAPRDSAADNPVPNEPEDVGAQYEDPDPEEPDDPDDPEYAEFEEVPK